MKRFGYTRYVAQGGDWGAAASWRNSCELTLLPLAELSRIPSGWNP